MPEQLYGRCSLQRGWQLPHKHIEETLPVVMLYIQSIYPVPSQRHEAICNQVRIAYNWVAGVAGYSGTHPTSSFYEGIVVRVNKNSWDKCLYTGTAEFLKMAAAWLGRESRTSSPEMEWSAAWSSVNGTSVVIKTFYKYPHVLSLQFQVQKFILQK